MLGICIHVAAPLRCLRVVHRVGTMTEPCPSTYGILICQRRSHTGWGSHRADLGSGKSVIWVDGCDETCTADCGWCKGELRRARNNSHPAESAGGTDEPATK